MNLTKLGGSSWILILNLLLLTILVIQIIGKWKENFVNYPQQVDPNAPIQENPDIAAANNNYAALLMFLKNNPSKSTNFIIDIKQKFFKEDCQVKNIDFQNLANFSDGVPFT